VIPRLARITVLAVSVLAVSGASASASVTLGQLAATPSGAAPTGVDFAQLGVSSGNVYTVPGNGTITSWSTNSIAGAQTLTMKIFRKVSDPAFYRAVGHDGPRNPTGGLLNTFATSIPVQTGDVIGLNSGGGANVINSATTGDTFGSKVPPGLNDGEAAAFTTGSGGKLNVSAVFVPSNTATLDTTVLNKKKGTATLNLTLPNPGDLTASGTGVSASSAGRAVASKAVPAGAAQLLVKATGKQRKKLNANGKVTLNVTITFTPTNGDPGTQPVKVKLKKKTK
jgi:hypothetical protein